jgi:cation diffusion facilitator CzcD-associated flavoprotein CzcO
MASFTSNVPVPVTAAGPVPDLVGDGWTSFPSFSGLVGGPNAGGLTEATTPKYLRSLHVLDLPRQERIRARVDETIHDKPTAQGLKPWYPGWCKRPCFHDDYLEAFNRPNVHLVDTAGQGVQRLTPGGFVVGANDNDIDNNGQQTEKARETAVDLLIFSTGYETFRAGTPASRARMTVRGRGGLTMDEKWASPTGVATLHGIFTHGFPNLILPGGSQAAGTVNVVHTMDVIATHAALVVAHTYKRAAGPQHGVVIEPTAQAEEMWSLKIANEAVSPSPMANCTPSYSNGEGKTGQEVSAAEKFKAKRSGAWARGLLDFSRILDEWRGTGELEGMEIQVVDAK